MNKKRFSIMLLFIDVLVIFLVVIIKGVSFNSVKDKDIKTASNILMASETALNEYTEKEIQTYIDSKPVIVYEDMTLEQLSIKLDNMLQEPMKGKGELLASFALEKGVDPYLATAIMLLETGCNSRCSQMVYNCNNIGGQKGSGCGAYQAFATLDEGIIEFINNLSNNYISKGLTTPETIGPKYAESNTWIIKVNNYIDKIRNS